MMKEEMSLELLQQASLVELGICRHNIIKIEEELGSIINQLSNIAVEEACFKNHSFIMDRLLEAHRQLLVLTEETDELNLENIVYLSEF